MKFVNSSSRIVKSYEVIASFGKLYFRRIQRIPNVGKDKFVRTIATASPKGATLEFRTLNFSYTVGVWRG